MIYGSVCSGIEAATAAWHPLGWKAAWLSEIEKFPSAVLQRHYPDVPNLGDMTTIHDRQEFKNGAIDLLVGGTPCQSFSVAGLRKGMADPRGNLALVFLRIADLARPRWIVWENVPGVLSSNRGRDFGAFLGALGQLGYGWSYRILDAQYFGVPQRRRRVFVVGYLGDWRRAAAVLFEPDCLRRNPAPSGKARAGVAALTATGVGTCGADDNQAQAGHLIAHTLRGDGFDASEDGTGRGTPIIPILEAGARNGRGGLSNVVPPLKAESGVSGKGDGAPLVFQQNSKSEVREMGDRTGAVTSGPGAQCQNYLKAGMAVRRLTPRECERLQGLPDDYTLVAWRGKPKEECPDGPRYKAIGNSMAVPCMVWLGERIQRVEDIMNVKKSSIVPNAPPAARYDRASGYNCPDGARPGDICVCIQCGAICEFDAGMMRRLVSEAQCRESNMACAREARAKIRLMRGIVR